MRKTRELAQQIHALVWSAPNMQTSFDNIEIWLDKQFDEVRAEMQTKHTEEVERLKEERDEAKASRQVALNAVDNLKGQLAALEADRDRLKRLLSACIPPAHEPQRSEYMAAMPKAKEGANDAD